MSTYLQILYQIVFGTRNQEDTLDSDKREELYTYISGILANKNCHLYCIGGVSNHMHIVTHLHPSIALASLVKDIKLASTDYIKRRKLFHRFNGWQNGYGAFTYTSDKKDMLIKYVNNQESHHYLKTFKEELIDLLIENKVDFDENYLLK